MQHNIFNQLPGYRAYEYQLVLALPEVLSRKIMQAKKSFRETIGSAAAAGSRPWLSLAAFTQLEMMEEKLTGRLKTVAMGFRPFLVELKDYGHFPAHTIYLPVSRKEGIRQLIREIKPLRRLMKHDPEHKPYFTEDPYIVIGRKLTPAQFEKAWSLYQHKHFSGRFIADAMLLLKRPVGAGPYQVAARLPFENLPVNTRQGDLFAFQGADVEWAF